jgi:protein gp37
MWKEPVKWNKESEKSFREWSDRYPSGYGPNANLLRPRVFCASMADVFEDWKGAMVNSNAFTLRCEDGTDMGWYPSISLGDEAKKRTDRPLTMDDVRSRLFRVIDATPHLDWLLLTKRPENIAKMLPTLRVRHCNENQQLVENMTFIPRENVWIGTSVEDQKTADERIPHLLKVPAAVRFLSMEPLLGPVDLSDWLHPAAIERTPTPNGPVERRVNASLIDWVIGGGESGPNARPCNVEWIRSIVRQCKAAGVPVFVKQLGDSPVEHIEPTGGPNT